MKQFLLRIILNSTQNVLEKFDKSIKKLLFQKLQES